MPYITSTACPITIDLYHYSDQPVAQMHIFSLLRNEKV